VYFGAKVLILDEPTSSLGVKEAAVGGVLGTDEVVRWTLSTLAASATGEVHLNPKASTTTGA
jgi:hypothetical protein